MHNVSRRGAGTLEMSPQSQKRSSREEESRKCDEQTPLLRVVARFRERGGGRAPFVREEEEEEEPGWADRDSRCSISAAEVSPGATDRGTFPLSVSSHPSVSDFQLLVALKPTVN